MSTKEYTFTRWATMLGTETVTFTVPADKLPDSFDLWTDEAQTDFLFDNFTLNEQKWKFESDDLADSGAWES